MWTPRHMRLLLFVNETCRLCRFPHRKANFPPQSRLYVFISFYHCFHPFTISSSSAFLFHLSHLSPPRFLLSLLPPFFFLSPLRLPPLFPPPALSLSLLTVTGNFASLPFCGGDKGGQCPLTGYVTGCHMRRTLWDGPALSAVTTQITSTASHLISTSNSISGN